MVDCFTRMIQGILVLSLQDASFVQSSWEYQLAIFPIIATTSPSKFLHYLQMMNHISHNRVLEKLISFIVLASAKFNAQILSLRILWKPNCQRSTWCLLWIANNGGWFHLLQVGYFSFNRQWCEAQTFLHHIFKNRHMIVFSFASRGHYLICWFQVAIYHSIYHCPKVAKELLSPIKRKAGANESLCHPIAWFQCKMLNMQDIEHNTFHITLTHSLYESPVHYDLNLWLAKISAKLPTTMLI